MHAQLSYTQHCEFWSVCCAVRRQKRVCTGLFFIGYAFFQLPSNLCCMLIGAPRWLAIIVATWGGVACLFATLRSKAQFYILRLLLGMVRYCRFVVVTVVV